MRKPISIMLKGGESYVVEDELFDELDAIYTDAESQLRRAAGWSKANPSKRKTPGGVKRFLVGWMLRSGKPRVTGHHATMPPIDPERNAAMGRLALAKCRAMLEADKAAA